MQTIPVCGCDMVTTGVDRLHYDECFLTTAMEALKLESLWGDDSTSVGSNFANLTEDCMYPSERYGSDNEKRDAAVTVEHSTSDKHLVTRYAGAAAVSVDELGVDGCECTRVHSYITVVSPYQSADCEARTALVARSNDPRNQYCSWKGSVLVQRALATVPEDRFCMSKMEIYIDSGCSNHMSPNASFLSDYKVKRRSGRVVFGSSEARPADIIGYGNVWELQNVAHVPDLSVMLISEGVLDREGHRIVKEDGVCNVWWGDLLIMSFTLRENNLYGLDDEFRRILCDGYCYYCTTNDPKVKTTIVYDIREDDRFPSMSEHKVETLEDVYGETRTTVHVYKSGMTMENPNDEGKGSKRKLFDPVSSDKDFIVGSGRKRGKKLLGSSNPLDILHNRFGHWNEKQIKELVRKKLAVGVGYDIGDIDNLNLGMCPACEQGKMKAETPKPMDAAHNWEAGEWWSFDIKQSPYATSKKKQKYFTLFVDRKSRYKKVYLMNTKDELPDVIEEHCESVAIDGHTWKLAVCDSEKVNLSQRIRDYLEAKKIRLKHSAPYYHSQNGLVESNIGKILDTTRTQMIASQAPERLWAYALLNAVYIANRMYNAAVEMTPFEAYTGVKPDVSNMVPFYSPGVCHITLEERRADKKLKNLKGRLIRMLGYDEDGKNTYIIRDVIRNTVMVRKDCMFNENLDPHVVKRLIREYEKVDALTRKRRQPDEFSDSEETPIRVTRSMTRVSDANVDQEAMQDRGLATEDPSEDATTRADESETSEKVDLELAMAYLAVRPELKDEMNTEGDSDFEMDDSDHDVALFHYTNALQAEVVNRELSLPPNPKNLDDAVRADNPHRDEWIEALRKEIEQMEKRGSFIEATEQTGRGMKSKLVFRVSYDNDYKLKFKVRLVMCGYSQIKGVDYAETYAPTPAISAILMMIHIAKVKNFVLASFDVSGAFLEGKNDFDIYCYLPKELGLGNRRRYKVINSVYGEKQAGKIWYDLNDDILIKRLSFVRCPANPNLYFRLDSDGNIVLTVHVDDALIAGPTIELIDAFVSEYKQHVTNITYWGSPVKKFVGIDFEEDGSHIYLSQNSYVLETLLKDRDAPRRVVHTPMVENVNLRQAKKNPENESLLSDTGKLRFIADRVRMDLLNVVGEISNGGDKEPSDEHLLTRDRVYDYLHCYPNRKLRLGGSDPVKMFGYVDASFGIKSRLGGALFLGLECGAFYAFSVSDRSTSLSSCEAEIKAIMRIVLPVIHFRDMLEMLGEEQKEPTDIFCDNQAAVEICKVLKMTNKTRHIQKIINFIREQINNRVMSLKFVPGYMNPADVLTKPLGREAFHRHTTTLLEGFNGLTNPEGDRAYLTLSDLEDMDVSEVKDTIRVHNTKMEMCDQVGFKGSMK